MIQNLLHQRFFCFPLLLEMKNKKYLSTFVEERDVLNKEFVEEKSYALVSNPVLFYKKLYESATEHKIINTLNGLKIIYGDCEWSHILVQLYEKQKFCSYCGIVLNLRQYYPHNLF